MNAFGVRFAVTDQKQFAILKSLFAEIKRDKDAGQFRDPAVWVSLVPDDLKDKFSWCRGEEREHWLEIRNSVVTVVPEPSDQLGSEWDFYRVFEAIEESEYNLLNCELVEPGIGEMHVNPHAYRDGGVGPFIALAESFGFRVLGVNECGRYESREELLAGRGGS